MSVAIKLLAIAGLVLVSVLLLGIVLDIKDFDKTSGGYEFPYVGVTGEPVDWDSMDLTATGLVKRGYVINVLVDGTTGMISFEIFKQKFDWRTFSDRALVVHKPRDAFIRLGFKPQF